MPSAWGEDNQPTVNHGPKADEGMYLVGNKHYFEDHRIDPMHRDRKVWQEG